ncbi:hypothetical protein HYC85_008674 [Camellia sinensis]|uniref:non-specific serine/threonine protein kinase n=1 Tax=Camellia sinensis TaxID=4442 RepID=A0A7J7HV28_CAMSI|nr:hypothetical protein HYC85_008674 [Camellia sinensis]
MISMIILQSPETSDSEGKGFGKEGPRTKLHKVGKHSTVDQSSPESMYVIEVPKGVKSFSHELGPKGGIRPVYHRAHSYNDLKELLGSLRSRFDAAKEVINEELAWFAGEVMELLQKNEFLSPEAQKLAEDLLILCQQCVEMTSSEFRAKCETVVQDLTEKRKQCETGLLKWLLTRMLFILTRCTRLLHFERGSESIDEKSLHKFKKCLDRVPSVEMNWDSDPVNADSGPGRSKVPPDECNMTSRKDFMVIDHNSFNRSSQIDVLSSVQEYHQVNGNDLRDSVDKASSCSLRQQGRSLDESDSVICRICEEVVPTLHLESHSYICAYAEKCDPKCFDLDDRLLKLAEMLEQIIESFNLSVHASYDNPQNSKIQIPNPATLSEGFSPKISEWRSKGVEGMFEDIHEMDTACIDDLTTPNLRGHLSMKLGLCGPSSSAGSITSGSSTNTPRTAHFDFFWLEHNNTSELEDVQQMTELVDIARCVAGTDLSKDGSHEFLLTYMEDLQDVLQHSKIKALVIDTFGGRIESLLREKYILACDLLDVKSLKTNSRHAESSKFLLDTASQSSTTSTPVHPSHKERTSIDDFEIIKPISRGAFGKVFLARKRTTGDLFAIKVLKKLNMIRKNDIEGILAERNILITVRNPFVVRFFYSFTSRDNLYLVIEYLNGGDLYSLLRKVGCLEEDVARIYIAELVLALEYLHSLGIVHRDLKPDNILIAHDGHIKVPLRDDLPGPDTDGITLLDAHDQHAQKTEDRNQQSAVGTPDYLAPEILLGTEHGYAADWWSVGIILFEFITGIPPFNAERPEIIFDNILSRKIPWPSVPDDMSYEAQDLIDRLVTTFRTRGVFGAGETRSPLGGGGGSLFLIKISVLVQKDLQRLYSACVEMVKAHPFFHGVNWDTLTLQKAAFVPHPDSVDDTSYFVSRYTQFSDGMPHDRVSSDSASDISESSSSGVEKMDECTDLERFGSALDLSLINFSFKVNPLAPPKRSVLTVDALNKSQCNLK